jgi:hypothetical protein
LPPTPQQLREHLEEEEAKPFIPAQVEQLDLKGVRISDKLAILDIVEGAEELVVAVLETVLQDLVLLVQSQEQL